MINYHSITPTVDSYMPIQKLAALLTCACALMPLRIEVDQTYYGHKALYEMTQLCNIEQKTVAFELDQLFAKILSLQVPPDCEIDTIIAENLTSLYQYGF